MLKHSSLLLLLILLPLFTFGQTGSEPGATIVPANKLGVDSEISTPKAIRDARPITWKSFILPTALFSYGGLSLNAPALKDINEDVHDATSAGPHTYSRPFLEDYLLLAPAVAVFGMNVCGLKGRNSVTDELILYGMSNLFASGISYGVKNLGVETRPDNTDNKSFPSGHTCAAFVSAEFLRLEYTGRVHWTVIAGGYLAAGSVAYLRLYHNKHWFGDVVAGAGIGMAGTRLSYLLYPHMKRWLSGDKKSKSEAMLLPTYNPDGSWGLAFVSRF